MSSTREKPEKPAPYSGTLIKRSLDMTDDDIKSSISYRDRSKSSSYLEDRITSQFIITNNNRASSASRYSAQSLNSVHSVQSLSPSMCSTASSVFNGHERLPEMPASPTTPKVRESGPETQETVCLQREKNIPSDSLLSSQSNAPLPTNKQVKATAKQEEKKKEGKKTAMDSSTESELYVFMAATDSIRESISSPHLLEDNMYVTMTPVSHRRPLKKEHTVHEYYNICHNDRIGNSLPDLAVKQPSIELSEDDERLEATPSTNKSSLGPGGVYEEVDYTRPIPPPRRKKLMKLQSQTIKVSEHSPSPARLSVSIIQPKEEASQPNRYTYNPDSRNSFIRKRTSTMPHKNSPNRQRRPIGMVFNDIVISEDLEKEIPLSPQPPVSSSS